MTKESVRVTATLLGKHSSGDLVKLGFFGNLTQEMLGTTVKEMNASGFRVILADPSGSGIEFLRELGWFPKITQFKDRAVQFWYEPGTCITDTHPDVKNYSQIGWRTQKL